MRIGSIVKSVAAFGRPYCGEFGVVTTCTGSAGHAGFKYVAWQASDGRHYIEGDFTSLLKVYPYRVLTKDEKARIDQIKAYIKKNSAAVNGLLTRL